MTSPLCKCGCGKPVERRSYETDGQWRRREKLGIYRDKCRKSLPSPSPKDRPTLVADPTAWNYERREGKEQPKEKRITDTAYEAWIRELPCIIPHCRNEAQSHHQNERGKGGKSTKPSSYRCLPVCAEHHTLGGTTQLPGSYHGMGKLTGWKFWAAYNIQVETVIHDLNRAYLEQGKTFKG